MVKDKRISFASNRGAASVLVVFMMIILVTFGALSLSAALANNRLGEKPGMWSNTYYGMDAKAEQALMRIDAALQSADTEARTVALEATDGTIESFNAAYADYYLSASEAMIASQGGENVTVDTDFTTSPTVTIIVQGPDDGMNQKYLTVTLNIIPPKFEYEADTYQRTEATLDRYIITEWREWQEHTVVIEEEEIWWDEDILEEDDSGLEFSGFTIDDELIEEEWDEELDEEWGDDFDADDSMIIEEDEEEEEEEDMIIEE